MDEAATPHVKNVGPHQHEWQTVGSDGSGNVYEECTICNTRHVKSVNPGAPARTDWLAGGDWDVEPSAEAPTAYHDPTLGAAVSTEAKKEPPAVPASDEESDDRPHLTEEVAADMEDYSSDEPTDAQVRAMNKTDLQEYAYSALGLELDKDAMSRDDMVEEILAARAK